MDLRAHLETSASPELLFAWVERLDTYPRWLGIVARAVPLDGDADAWAVDLQGRLGPFARSKRLRMVRTAVEPAALATFERRELDGRRHSPWVLHAAVTRTATGGRLDMHLHYGGALWGPVLERLLGDEIERGRERLAALVAAGERPGVA